MAFPLIAGVGLGLSALGVGSKIANWFSADDDQNAAQAALDELSKQPYPQLRASPELLKFYQKAASGVDNPAGLTAGEKAAYRQNVANSVNTMVKNATNASGGQIGKFLRGALNPAIINYSNQLITQDAALKRANRESSYGRLGSAVSAIQGINDRNTQAELGRRMGTEQFLGQSVLQNKAYKNNFWDSMGSDLLGAGLMLGFGGIGRPTGSGGQGYDMTGYQNSGAYSPINGGPNIWKNRWQ